MGRYIVTLTAYNQISSDTHRLELFVVDRVCRLPEFDIHSQVMDKDNKVNKANKVGIHGLRRLATTAILRIFLPPLNEKFCTKI